jgi:hypothetical protein
MMLNDLDLPDIEPMGASVKTSFLSGRNPRLRTKTTKPAVV